jgi:hypothetical protein
LGVLRRASDLQPTSLFDPAYLSDPRIAKVAPASAVEWYHTPEGQWFLDQLAPELLSKQVLDSHDPQARDSSRGALATPITCDRNATYHMATHGGRILFGTDTPSAPTYANHPGLNGRQEMQRMVRSHR